MHAGVRAHYEQDALRVFCIQSIHGSQTGRQHGNFQLICANTDAVEHTPATDSCGGADNSWQSHPVFDAHGFRGGGGHAVGELHLYSHGVCEHVQRGRGNFGRRDHRQAVAGAGLPVSGCRAFVERVALVLGTGVCARLAPLHQRTCPEHPGDGRRLWPADTDSGGLVRPLHATCSRVWQHYEGVRDGAGRAGECAAVYRCTLAVHSQQQLHDARPHDAGDLLQQSGKASAEHVLSELLMVDGAPEYRYVSAAGLQFVQGRALCRQSRAPRGGGAADHNQSAVSRRRASQESRTTVHRVRKDRHVCAGLVAIVSDLQLHDAVCRNSRRQLVQHYAGRGREILWR